MTNEKIRVYYSNIIYRDYTTKEINKHMNDLDFLRDAVLYLLNPELANESEMEISTHRDSILKSLRHIYVGDGWNQDFVNMFFTEIDNSQYVQNHNDMRNNKNQ
jgi:hypothetical protein